jgi:flavin reductase (DIM6/NTAB) family NADH-FMN oxidoreductase RutF
MSQAPFDTRQLRNALGQFATGIAIVTAIDPDGRPIGLTVNSFSAVSLEPALVLWCLDNRSVNLDAFRQASHHAINILSAGQLELSNLFASRAEDRFAAIDWQPGLGGAPVLPGCCARFEVANETQQLAGDHTLFIGRVERLESAQELSPLLYHGSGYRTLAAS